MKVVKRSVDAPQTMFDVANIEQDELIEGMSAFYGSEIPEEDVADIVLAELVRRYVREDRSPPGAQNQTRTFDVVQIAAELPISLTREDVEQAYAELEGRELATHGQLGSDVPFESEPGHVRLTQTGVERGLALIEKFVPRPHYALGTLVVDSRKWTGLTRRVINESNRDKIVSAIEKAILLVDEKVPDNERHAQAIGYLRAAIALAEMPEPPSRQIWEFVHRAAAIGGLLGLFVTIFTAAV